MKPKIKDVAQLAGVSPTTVSRVLNNRGYISEETREKVYKAMKELSYYPNDLARSLYTKRTNLLGLIVPETINPFFGELAFHIENICASLNYKVLICNSLNRKDKEEKYVEMLIRNQVDGVIAVTYNRGILNYQKELLPIVAIDHYLSETIPVVNSDNYAGGVQATELLISKGCQHIIHINGPLEIATPVHLRRKGYEDVMKKYGKTPYTYEMEEVYTLGKELINKIFDEQPEVDGIFACGDLPAFSLITEARKRGINIPNDLKIIGYDGTEMIQTLVPELTTIQQPIKLIAQTAIDILLKEISGDYTSIPSKTRLPVKLIEGLTT